MCAKIQGGAGTFIIEIEYLAWQLVTRHSDSSATGGNNEESSLHTLTYHPISVARSHTRRMRHFLRNVLLALYVVMG